MWSVLLFIDILSNTGLKINKRQSEEQFVISVGNLLQVEKWKEKAKKIDK